MGHFHARSGTDNSLSGKLLALMQRRQGWRLWLIFTLASVCGAVAIVSVMSWLFNGEITYDYVVTGLVAAGCVAPVSLALLTRALKDMAIANAQVLALEGDLARNKLHATLQALPDLLFELDNDGRFLDYHAPRNDVLALPAEAFLGKSLIQALPPAMAAACADALSEARDRGHAIGAQYPLATPTGQRWFELSVCGERTDGLPQRYVVLARDVTERRMAVLELAASRALLQAVVDTVPLRVFWKDRQSRYLGCNPVFACDAGLGSAQDLIGKRDNEMIWQAQADVYQADDEQVMRTGVPRLAYEEQQTGPHGRQLWLRTSKVPLRDASNHIVGVLGVYDDVTLARQADQLRLASDERAKRLATMLRLVSDNVPDMIWAKDLEKRYLFANKAICEQLLGAASTDEPIGRNDLFFAQRERARHPDNPLWHTFGEICQETDDEALRSNRATQFDESGYVRGQFICLDVHKAPLFDDQGRVIGVVGSARNVTAHKAAQEKLLLASLVLNHSSEAMLATNAANSIVDVNPAFTALTGYTRDEVVGKNPSILQSGLQGAEFYGEMWRALETQGRWQGELWNKRKNGEVFAEWLTINTICHPDGSVNRRVALFSDITERKRAAELIWKQANFDALTHLPNRHMFQDRLEQELIKSRRSGLRLAVLYIDLDHFKEVNDSFGHETGDLLLAEAACRISACVRASDTVARLGGDEFTVILAELDDPMRVETIATHIIGELTRGFVLNQREAHVSASIGITLYPDDASSLERLLQNADQAMYAAKRAGRNRFCVFIQPGYAGRAAEFANLTA